MSTHALKCFIAGLSLVCTSVFAGPIVFDFTSVPSYDVKSDPGNTVLTFNVGANAVLTNVAYTFILTAFSPSFLSEMNLQLSDSAELHGVIFTPSNDEFSGTGTFTGMFDLAALNLTFNVLDDGILRLEFFETRKDLPTGAPDGEWGPGQFTFNAVSSGAVPEPSSAGLFGLGGLLLLLRSVVRRRAQNA